MWRSIHSWLGLAVILPVLVLALTGSVLSTQPLYNAYTVSKADTRISVAELIKRIAKANPRIVPQRLIISPAGEAKLSYTRHNRRKESTISPDTGKFLPPHKEPAFYVFTRKLHRSFLLGEKGRIIPAAGGIAMTLLSISGLFLLLRRLGGWRQFCRNISLRGAANLHAAVGRIALLALLISAVTALWLSGVTFHLIPSGTEKPPSYPESLKKLDPVEPWQLKGLQNIPLNQVSEIIYPIPEDWFDVWSVKTQDKYIFIDQFTGDVLSAEALPLSARIMDWVMRLHTGEGLTPWAVVLLLSSLTVPLFVVTGVMIWLHNRRRRGKIRHNASQNAATTLIAVGSENGSTRRFARSLHNALHEAGENVRTIDMNALRPFYPNLKRLLVLTATYGDGDAPQSAARFLPALAKNRNQDIAYATLGFGDKAFPAYCAFARRVDKALAEKFTTPLLPLTEVDKQSAQTFEHWCHELSTAIQQPLEVHYAAQKPKTHTLQLISKTTFGQSLGTIVTVLRFGAKKLPRFVPGDLVGIYPPDCPVPRLYSVGSDSCKDGYLEICVRLQEGGLCSTLLCQLTPGESIDCTVSINERFRLPKRAPVVMICAGTGIAPFTGMIRHNTAHRALDLYWGGRHPDADALYHDDIARWLADKHLSRFVPAWSRLPEKHYVQDKIRADREHLLSRLQEGATVMVCGGQAMAAAVREELDRFARELGTDIAGLKRKNRYTEDVY